MPAKSTRFFPRDFYFYLLKKNLSFFFISLCFFAFVAVVGVHQQHLFWNISMHVSTDLCVVYFDLLYKMWNTFFHIILNVP